jgi:hypothetical protein
MPEQLDITNLEVIEDKDSPSPVEEQMNVLEWVNAKRREKGWRPIDSLPQGVPGNSYYCPIAIALDSDVSIHTFNGGHGILPASVKDWVKAYDDGAYPDLVSEDLMRCLDNEVERTSLVKDKDD